jgi:hypothetical protein
MEVNNLSFNICIGRSWILLYTPQLQSSTLFSHKIPGADECLSLNGNLRPLNHSPKINLRELEVVTMHSLVVGDKMTWGANMYIVVHAWLVVLLMTTELRRAE